MPSPQGTPGTPGMDLGSSIAPMRSLSHSGHGPRKGLGHLAEGGAGELGIPGYNLQVSHRRPTFQGSGNDDSDHESNNHSGKEKGKEQYKGAELIVSSTRGKGVGHEAHREELDGGDLSLDEYDGESEEEESEVEDETLETSAASSATSQSQSQLEQSGNYHHYHCHTYHCLVSRR